MDKSKAELLGCRCSECPLLEAEGPVLPELAQGATFTILGEAAGPEEIRHGRPFVGKRTGMLDHAMKKAGLQRKDTIMHKVVMCQPDKNDMKRVLAKLRKVNAARRRENNKIAKRNKDNGADDQEPLLELKPTPQECCRPATLKLLRRTQPRHIFVLGKEAARAVLGGDPGIQAIRGALLDGNLAWDEAKGEMRLLPPGLTNLAGQDIVKQNVRIVPGLSEGLVFAKRRWLGTLIGDLDRLVRWSKQALRWQEPRVTYSPPPHELQKFLSGPGPFTYDLETDGIEAMVCNTRCVGIGNKTDVVVVGIRSKQTWNIERTCGHCDGGLVHESPTVVRECPICFGVGLVGREDTRFYAPAMMEHIKEILRNFFVDPTKLKIGHNAGYYDLLAVRRWLGVNPAPTLDTILLHRLAESELPHSLSFVGTKYTDVHSWKADRQGRKLATEAESDRELHHYCLAEGTPIVLADGSTRPIETIVRNRQKVSVLSNFGGRIQPCEVTDWFYTVEDNVKWVQIQFKDRQRGRGLICTHDHGVYVEGRGQLEAETLRAGMRVLHHEPQMSQAAKCALVGTLVGDTQLSVSPVHRKNVQGAPTAYVHGGHSESSGFSQYKCLSIPCLRLGSLDAERHVTINGRCGVAGPFRKFLSTNMHQLAALIPLVLDEAGKHKLSTEALDYMGAPGLAWLYMDDGCVQKKDKPDHSETCVLSLQRYPRDQLIAAHAWFKAKFGAVYLGTDGVFRFSVPASEKFARMIAPHLPEKARYKLPRIVGVSAWPPAIPVVCATQDRPSSREILSVRPYLFDQTKRHQRYRSRRRYCLGVKGPHNFFTSFGLVSNCALDVSVTAAVVEPLIADVAKTNQNHLVKIDHQIQAVCADMKHVGMYVDQEERNRTEVITIQKIVKLRKEIQGLCGDSSYNPASTRNVQEVLFENWGLTPPLDEKFRFTPGGDPSTGDPILRSLLSLDGLAPHQRKFIWLNRQYRKLMKELGTYVVKLRPMTDRIEGMGWDDDDDEDVKQERLVRGYEKRGCVWADGRMRPGYNAQGTLMGRLSSSRPINAQNFPKHLRRLITPQPGNVLVGADYDQLELRVAASRWQLTKYLEAFAAGWDPHTSVTALAVFGEAFRVAAAALGLPFPWMSGTKFAGDANDFRQLAKIIQYAYQYKASVETGAGIIQSTEISDPDTGGTKLPYLKMPVRKVRQMRENWLAGVPGLEPGWNREIRHFRQQHYIEESVHGRRRYFLDGENPNEIVNTPIQGAAAGLVNTAMIALHKDIPLHKWGAGTGILTQTHDSMVIECPRDKAQWVIECMDHHMNMTHPSLPGVAFTAKAEQGMTWKAVG